MFQLIKDFLKKSVRPPATADISQSASPPKANSQEETEFPFIPNLPEIFIDTETTGLNYDGRDEVLEIAIIDAEGITLLNTFVRPVRNQMWPNAQAVHGIGPRDVENAPTWEELLPSIASITQDKTAVFYNAAFDRSFFPAGFFKSMACAMQRYSEVNPEGNRWVRLSDAAANSGYVPSGPSHRAYEDARASRHVWLIGIPELNRRYPKTNSPHIVADVILESGSRLPVQFDERFPDQIRFVSSETICPLWIPNGSNKIYVYRPEGINGVKRIASLSIENNSELAKRVQEKYDVEMSLKYRRDDVLFCEIIVKLSKKMLRDLSLPKKPIKYSTLDKDIFTCFIAHKSGWINFAQGREHFSEIEKEIARVCRERGGHYYKSKAKGAKFAIILYPYAQTAYNVWSLQKEGYKVTAFDLALQYFGLESLWDCTGYLDLLKDLGGNFETLRSGSE